MTCSVNQNIPVLKCGRDMEIEEVNTFADCQLIHDCIISECGLFLDETMPYTGVSSG